MFKVGLGHRRTIGTVGYWGVSPNTIISSGAVWVSANRIIYVPIRVPEPMRVLLLHWDNGAAVSGNVQIGLYNADGVRLATSGTVAQAGVNTLQSAAVDVTIGWGMHYIALTLDNTTGTIFRASPAAAVLNIAHVRIESPGVFGLPATATFAAPSDAYLPACGLATVSVL